MPIYEYVCRECGKELEKLQKMSDASLTDCPECGAAALKRKVSAAAFRLAGGGWYETDFKTDHRHNIAGAKAEEKSSANGAGASDKSSADASGKGSKHADKPTKSASKSSSTGDSKAATGS